MKYQSLGWSDMKVSRVCLGTMTFGQQNTEEEAHEQLDYAIKKRGVNFLDTAELYPVPTKRETQGLTEKYIGTWLAKNADLREKVYVATKVMGYSKTSHIPSGRDPGAQYLARNSPGPRQCLTNTNTWTKLVQQHYKLKQIHHHKNHVHVIIMIRLFLFCHVCEMNWFG